MSLLSISNLSKRFGALTVIDDLDLNVGDNEILGLVGPNGAGKTTLFNLITGFVPISSGKIEFAGHNITRLSPYRRTNAGMARTFQTPQLFSDMSVFDNVRVGGLARRIGAGFRMAASRPSRTQVNEQLDELVAIAGLTDVRWTRAGDLPYGHQRKLEIARALMTKPQLLLLDEPAAGMMPYEVGQMNQLIKRIQKMGCTIIVVDHNMRLIMDVCERIAVMNFGKLIAVGDPQHIRASPEVVAAYLGGQTIAHAG